MMHAQCFSVNLPKNFACPIYTENITGLILLYCHCLFSLMFPLVFMNSKQFWKNIYLKSFEMNVGNHHNQPSSNDKKKNNSLFINIMLSVQFHNSEHFGMEILVCLSLIWSAILTEISTAETP